MTVPVMETAVRRAGLAMVLRTVKTRLMVVISPAMIMMVVTVKVVEPLVVAVKTAMTANMIGQLTDLNAVIRHGVSMALTVQH